MTDREHLLALRADIGTLMATVAILLLDSNLVPRANADFIMNRAQQIVTEIEKDTMA